MNYKTRRSKKKTIKLSGLGHHHVVCKYIFVRSITLSETIFSSSTFIVEKVNRTV